MVDSKAVDVVSSVLGSLNSLVLSTDCSAMPDSTLVEYRKVMSKIASAANIGLAKTGRKELCFDEDEIVNYIDCVLQRGFNLVETKPSDFPKLKDAQNLRRYKSIIKRQVKDSVFGVKQFDLALLSIQRAAIENSGSLHELRQRVNAMIPVLKLYRDYTDLIASYNKLMDSSANWVASNDYDQVLLELEAVKKQSEERKRVIDCMVDGLYKPTEKMADDELLLAIEAFKAEHQCSDSEAAEVFGISRSKITRLRRSIKH